MPNLDTNTVTTRLDLPELSEEEKCQKFLRYPPATAGRSVILTLYGSGVTSREARQALWQRHKARGTNLSELGKAAQQLESAGWNWRHAKRHRQVIKLAKLIPSSSV